MSTTPSININLSVRIAELLSPKFGVAPGPKVIAKYFCKVLSTIAREGLPVKIYLDHHITERITPILKELGIKFRTVPVSKMEPPYVFLFIDEETGRLVVEICDLDLKKRSFVTRFDLFIDELTLLLMEVRKKAENEATRVMSSRTMEMANDKPTVHQFTTTINTAKRAKPRNVLSQCLNSPVEATKASESTVNASEASSLPRRSMAEVVIDAVRAIFDLGSSLWRGLEPLIKEKPWRRLSLQLPPVGPQLASRGCGRA